MLEIFFFTKHCPPSYFYNLNFSRVQLLLPRVADIENLVFMIGIIVANVPEGLLATVTVCLTLTAKRMHAKMVLVKNLEGVETLGSTSCICSDKTGTLTQNVMTVAQVVYGAAATGSGGRCTTEDALSSFTGGRKTYDVTNKCFSRLLRCGTLCNVATFVESSKWEVEEDDDGGETRRLDEDGNFIPRPFQGYITQGDGSRLLSTLWRPVGNASECAMIKLAQSEVDEVTGEGDVDRVRAAHPTKFVIPFNSKNKYQVHVHERTETGDHWIMMKGAPERIVGRCSHVMIGDKIVEMTEEERRNIEEQQEALSSNGLRCLGFAERRLDPEVYGSDYKYAGEDNKHFSPNFPLGDEFTNETDSQGRRQHPSSTDGLVFLGMMALVDPPRPAVPPAVEKCKTAGVKVIMVTGDHPVTAQAIAYKVGILWSKTRGDMERDNARYGRSPGDPDYENPDDAEAIVVPGHEISVDMSEERWDFILGHSQIVFARTSPQQKLVIVENNQRQGHIVAVTGDGVNDSPAIKKADIGIAMGIMGSEVSKQAADMILLDDNFASIVKGVEEGRLIFDNLKKSIAYTIQSNIPEITPFLAFIMFVIPLPLTTFLILAIDLGTDMIPAISMAYELPEADIMMRPPRNAKTDRLVTKRMINFSYGQIGMIQAMAGFYTYLVVLNDYGYPPTQLIMRGNSEAWGKQPLFCKFNGGNYVDVQGNANADLDPSKDPPTREFPFWFEGLSGYVTDCGYSINNYASGGGVSPPSVDFDYRDSSTYGGGTRGKHSATVESYQANERAGYFEYIPWRAKTSAFWDDRYLHWDTDDKNGPLNMGAGTEQQVYFAGRAAGLWSLCGAEDNNRTFGAGHGSAQVRGMLVPGGYIDSDPNEFDFSDCSDQAEMTDLSYGAAVFCNGQKGEVEERPGCSRVTYGAAADRSPDVAYPTNRHQTFYCMGWNQNRDENSQETCGSLTDSADSLPYCLKDGTTRCGMFGMDGTPDDGKCRYMCSGVCYWPGSDATNPVTGSNSTFDKQFGGDPQTSDYRQCYNLASSEVAYESLKHAQGAFFGSIVVGQIAGLLVCKTRWLSIATQGMRNNFMLFGIGTEILLVAWLAYCIPINSALGTRNIRLVHWFCGIPFAIVIFMYDECRKALMRATSIEKTDPITGQVTRDAGWLETNCAY